LPVEPYPVAIPHTNVEHIVRPFIPAGNEPSAGMLFSCIWRMP